MGSSLRLYAGLVTLSALLVIIAVLGNRGGIGASGESLPPKQGVNRIAYVGLDGLIHAVNPDGSEPSLISPENGVFTWPTWSPDARRLVFSGAVLDERGDLDVSLFSFNVATGQLGEIYVSERGIYPFITQDQSVVHYPMWSPDARSLTFIAQTSRGLSLFFDNIYDGAEATVLLDQGPLWTSWSPDSSRVIVHRGSDDFLVNTVGEVEVRELEIQSSIYRVPAWTPDGQSITLAAGLGVGGYTLFTADIVPEGIERAQPITSLPPFSTFLWSPSGDHLAVGRSADLVLYGGSSLVLYVRLVLVLMRGDTAEEALAINDNTLAYFWSPDGSKLAYVTVSDIRGALSWKVLDLEERVTWHLVDFVPSRDQLTMFEFFDQYAYSHFLWSPDSSFLVFAGQVRGEAASASVGSQSGHSGAHIIVLDCWQPAKVGHFETREIRDRERAWL